MVIKALHKTYGMGKRNRTFIGTLEVSGSVRWTIPTYKIAALGNDWIRTNTSIFWESFKEKIADRSAAYTDLF